MALTRYLAEWLHRTVLAPLVMRTGVASTLTVPGRKTGKPQRLPVNVLEFDDQRYLVSPRGETQWVRNLRAAGGGELRRHGRAERFTAEEVPDDMKPDIVAAYRRRWDYQAKNYFEALPDPADHPVFRILPSGRTARRRGSPPAADEESHGLHDRGDHDRHPDPDRDRE